MWGYVLWFHFRYPNDQFDECLHRSGLVYRSSSQAQSKAKEHLAFIERFYQKMDECDTTFFTIEYVFD